MNSGKENIESSSWWDGFASKNYIVLMKDRDDVFGNKKPEVFHYDNIYGGIRECARKVREEHPELLLKKIEER